MAVDTIIIHVINAASGNNMQEQDYSKRELDMKFLFLSDQINTNHKETTDALGVLDRRNTDKQKEIIDFLSEIKTQTQKTNGRVNRLEAWRMGIVMCGALVVIVVLPLIVVLYNNIIKRLDMHTAAINSIQNK